MELRPTTVDDLSALHATFVEAVGELFVRHGFPPPAPALDVFSSIQQHILDTGTSVVAEHAGRVVGFASAWTRGDDWFLASLFVSPSVQAGGVGSALLDAVWGSAERRRTLTDAIQPISNVLYARRGLIPSVPMLTFAGVAAPGEAPQGDEAPADLAAIDAVAYGFDRAVDHRYWERAARRTTWGDAYSYAFTGGDIGPIAGLTPAAAARALAAELGRAVGEVRVRVPGSARQLVEVALAARLRLDAVPGLLLLSPGAASPTALAPSGYLLY